MDLKTFQDRFQKAIVADDDGILANIPNSDKESREVLLGVYRDAYLLRIIEIIGAEQEKLSAFLGEEQFAELVRAYMSACPSRHPNARWIGARLPEFLSSAEPYSEHQVLADLAALEKALGDAFDAADAPVLGLEDLAPLPPGDWERLSFRPHPAAQRLDLGTNAANIWIAIDADDEPPEPAEALEAVQVLVWRQDTPTFRVLGREEAMMWDEAAKGVRFGVLCELAATFEDPDTAAMRAAQYLQGWLTTAALTGYAINPL